MAMQSEGPGQIQEFLDILRRRKWQIVMPAIVFLALGIFAAVVVPKKFKVSTQVELRGMFLGDDSRQAARDHTLGVAENATQQLQSPKRIREVLESPECRWPDYLTLDATGQAEFNERIRENLMVSVPRRSDKAGSSFVTIEFTDVNKDRAQIFLKTLRKAWIEQVVERERTRHDVEYQKLLNREAELEKEYANAIRKQTSLRNENDLSPTQSTTTGSTVRMEDPSFQRLERAEERQDVLEQELAAATDTALVAAKQLAETEPEVPKTKVTEGLSFQSEIEKVNTDQLELEGQLEGIRPEHPRYKIITRKLEDLDTRRAELELKQTGEQISLEFKPNPLYAKLEATVMASELTVSRLIAEQESLRKQIEKNRNELRLKRDALAADEMISNEIDIITSDMKKTNADLSVKQQRREVIYGPQGNPFQVIEEVQPPSDPTEPNPMLIVIFSLVLGLGAGLGSAVLMEVTRSSFRSAADLHRVLMLPVLGVIGPIVTQGERSRKFVGRVASGSLCLVLVTSILFLTWAWVNEPDLLGDTLNDGIQDLRSLFL